MLPLKLRENPEAEIQKDIIKMLRLRGWYVKTLHGGKFQSGMPDLFASHKLYRIRLIEVKLPEMKGSRFTAAQLDVFPKLILNGAAFWILTAATETEYQKLFDEPNAYKYLGGLY